MSWRDDLRRVKLADGRELIAGSFRGVPFFVESAERTGGRRTVTHEFPLRDEPYIEDIGRASATFAIEAYVIGDDYLVQKNALLDALEKSGPGEMVHPYWGIHQVVCDSLRVSETRSDGGIARFSLTLLRVSSTAAAPPVSAPDLAAQTVAVADIAQAASLAEFTATYEVADEPAFALVGPTEYLEAVSSRLLALLAPLASTAQESAVLAKQADDLIDAADTLVRTPAAMVDAVVDAITTMAESAEVPARTLVRALLDLVAGDDPVAPTATTATRDTERANLDAMAAALRRTFLTEAARAIVAAEYDSHEDATSDANELAAALEEQAAVAGDSAYPELVLLRARVLRAVPGRSVLARLVDHTLHVTTPSLLLSYQLYGSVNREADILARNSVRHPALIAGTVQVLSNV